MAETAERAKGQVQEGATRAKEHAQQMAQQLKEKAPASRQVVRGVVFVAGLAAVLAIGGLMLAAAAVTLMLAAPTFLVLSPILVPLGFLTLLVTGGFLSTEAVLVAAASALSWLYNYAKGRHPLGSDQVDAAKSQILGTATHMKEMAKEYCSNVTGFVQSKAHEAAPGA